MHITVFQSIQPTIAISCIDKPYASPLRTRGFELMSHVAAACRFEKAGILCACASLHAFVASCLCVHVSMDLLCVCMGKGPLARMCMILRTHVFENLHVSA